MICPDRIWNEQHLNLLLGKAMIGVNQPDKVLIQFDGTEEGHDYLVWAAGGCLRKLRFDGPNFEASTLFVRVVR